MNPQLFDPVAAETSEKLKKKEVGGGVNAAKQQRWEMNKWDYFGITITVFFSDLTLLNHTSLLQCNTLYWSKHGATAWEIIFILNKFQ